MINNDLFKINQKPRYFYSFVVNKWIYNKNILNENETVTKVGLLTTELAIDMIGRMPMSKTNHKMMLAVVGMTLDELYEELVNSNHGQKLELIKENFHVYIFNNQKTIIWKELLEEII